MRRRRRTFANMRPDRSLRKIRPSRNPGTRLRTARAILSLQARHSQTHRRPHPAHTLELQMALPALLHSSKPRKLLCPTAVSFFQAQSCLPSFLPSSLSSESPDMTMSLLPSIAKSETPSYWLTTSSPPMPSPIATSRSLCFRPVAPNLAII